MVLVDNNALSSLAKIDRLETLPAVFEDVATTPSVLDELHRDAVAGYDFIDRIHAAKGYEGGWLGIVSPTDSELELTDQILDQSLSFTDAELIAMADRRAQRLLTDDGHAGTIATRRGVETWDLTLFVRAACEEDVIETADELRTVVDALRREDYYEFSERDEQFIFDGI